MVQAKQHYFHCLWVSFPIFIITYPAVTIATAEPIYFSKKAAALPPNARNYSFAFSLLPLRRRAVAATVASRRVDSSIRRKPWHGAHVRSMYILLYYCIVADGGGQSASNVAMATATFPPRGHGNDRRKRLPISRAAPGKKANY